MKVRLVPTYDSVDRYGLGSNGPRLLQRAEPYKRAWKDSPTNMFASRTKRLTTYSSRFPRATTSSSDLLLLNADAKKMKTSDINKFANTLVVTNYTKGVAGDLDVMDKDTDRTGVSTETFVDRGTVNKTAMALRFTINWKTLRFKRSVTVAGKVGDYAVYGKCEDRTVPNK